MSGLARLRSCICVVACAACLSTTTGAQQDGLADYTPSPNLAGTVRVCGSPQMGDLLKLYEEGFALAQPSVHFEEDLKSTVTAVAGVYTDHADIGLLGREIWPTEVRAFQSAKGHAPTVIDVATGSYDVPKATFALMIFVPKDNPVSSLTAQQLEGIFAAGPRSIHTWGELGLGGEWAKRPVHPFGFSVDNDKSRIFARLVFHGGERWNPDLKEFINGSASEGPDAGELILRAVADDPDSIGISNAHYGSPSLKTIPLSFAAQTRPVAPTRESVANRSYPLSRAVYMVINQDANHAPNPALLAFLRYVLSRQGRRAVQLEGNYLPLPKDVALKQLERLDAPQR